MKTVEEVLAETPEDDLVGKNDIMQFTTPFWNTQIQYNEGFLLREDGSGAFNGLARKYPDIGLADNLHFTSSQLASAEARVQNFIEELGIMNNEQKNRISFTVGGETVYAALYDNSVARDLVFRLPLTLEFSDYNGTEKIAYLPDGSEDWDLSDAPTNCTPSAGDIAMYAPWGNLAIFYRDFGYSNGLVPFGRLDDGAIELFASQNGDFAVTIRAA